MVARVFVSHAGSDAELADRVHQTLTLLGHRVFLAQNIRVGVQPGDMWKDRLHRELRAADAVVCVITNAYNASPWCAYELGIAYEVGSLLLPLRVEPTVTSPLLEDRQHVHLHENPGWADNLNIGLRRVEAGGGLGWADDRSPFPGLRPFTRDMAKVFYGRGNELRRLTHRLRSLGEQRLLLVVGASGCGKSSLVTAGLPAQLAGEPGWEVADPFWPGRDPVRKLAHTLTQAARRVGQQWAVTDIDRQLREDDLALMGLAEELLTAGSGPVRDSLLLLIIDQGEELFTRSDEEERARLATLLRHGVTGPVRVVMALRSEFQDQVFALPELSGPPEQGGVNLHVFPLRPLARDMLPVVITEPARVAGLHVEPELVARMVADTEDGEALPLLAFTLHELAKDQTRGGTLSMDRYHELGGVRGALARRADAVLDDAVETSGLGREEILVGMAELATLDEAGRRTRRRIDLKDLPSDALRRTFQVFVNQWLLSTPSDSLGTAVGVVHEALLTAWKPLDAVIREREAALLSEGKVERAAAEWEHNDGPLWDEDRLTTAITTLWQSYERFRAGEEPVVHLKPAGRRFIDACDQRIEEARRQERTRVEAARRRERHERQRRQQVIAVLSVLLVFTVVGAAVATWQSLTARQAQRTAERAQRTTERARHALITHTLLADADAARATDQVRALRLAIAAEDIDPGTGGAAGGKAASGEAASGEAGGKADRGADSRANLLQTLAEDPNPLASRGDPVTSVAFSPDGRILAVGGANATVVLWDVTEGQHRRIDPPLTGQHSGITSVTFSPDSRNLDATGVDGTVLRWDVTDPDRPQLRGRVNAAAALPTPWDAFSPDGRLRATGQDGSIMLADVTAPDRPRPPSILLADPGPVRAVAFSPHGQVLAAVGSGRRVWLWDTSVTPPRQIGQPLTGHTRSVLSLAFSPDGGTLASGGNDGTVRLWRLAAIDAFRRNGVVEYACHEAQGGLDRSAWSFHIPGLPYQDTCAG
ncbi:WD-40 repeat-containing protein [Frankia casuarinae]|nr:WD-40 repeat-containing protein [Frankia casuarinae]